MAITGTLRWLIWLIAAFIGLGCSSAAQPPAPPPTSTSSNLQSDDFGDDDEFEDDEFEDDEEEDDEDEEDEGDGSEYERGGAEIGDAELQEQVTECLDDGKFYDRFAGDSGDCSRRDLANIDCTEEGIVEHLSKKLQQQFEDALESSAYKDYDIDQCVDCPPGSSNSICEQADTGASQTGTKIFFVKEEDTELLGKAILLPVRPNQTEDGDSEEEEEEEDTTEDEETTEEDANEEEDTTE